MSMNTLMYLDSLGKSPYVLGNVLWEEHFDSLLYLRIMLSTRGRHRKLNYMVMT